MQNEEILLLKYICKIPYFIDSVIRLPCFLHPTPSFEVEQTNYSCTGGSTWTCQEPTRSFLRIRQNKELKLDSRSNKLELDAW